MVGCIPVPALVFELARKLGNAEEHPQTPRIAFQGADYNAADHRFGLRDFLDLVSVPERHLLLQHFLEQRLEVSAALCSTGWVA